MPEGPEVKKLVNVLNEYKGLYVIDCKITPRSRYRDKAPDNFTKFKEKLPLKLKKVYCKGKFIYFVFKPKFFMTNTLGMSGYWSVTEQKHVSLELNCKFKDNNFNLYFIDMRHFGTIKFYELKRDLDDKLKSIGIDFLSDKTFNVDLFIKIIRKHNNKNITKVLMNQSIFSGIGNYIKSESLYRAKINPTTDVKDLNDIELEILYNSIKFVMTSSYKNTLDFQVYRKKYDPFGNKVFYMTTPDKRTTYYV